MNWKEWKNSRGTQNEKQKCGKVVAFTQNINPAECKLENQSFQRKDRVKF
jgi:hypothetical protein